MPRNTTVVLAALLVFGTASAVFADTPSRTMSNDRIAAVNDAASEKEPFVASQLGLLESAFFCRGGSTGGAAVWVKLTEPGGKPIHINLEHITSVRSATQVPGARAQLDLASGKFQGVQQDVEEVMQLISAASGARGNDNNS
jgi:hypothetical protein